ncbi:MAG: gluconokinase [Hamadaea sp.]|uniref:gluconokinase n=1 Tax=Hamadaea sp. TaxID=2024425 RepID=UPI0018527C7F|nr:gluconokinase [Hamadaea sp.]NUR49358.1 gluconokinase [Hamadaea sp.]NUR69443.1 gluconokinase [Hamadaea sp.]NUT23394.1 gluconokinase [Hamadaea sp.]
MDSARANPVRHVVVMGVSGCGKSTVARRIAERTGFLFADADDFHSEENIERMRRGVPLNDADRGPWLNRLAWWLAQQERLGVSTVLACSALRRSYRDVLRSGAPSLDFVHLDGPMQVIQLRLAHRAGHYMPASLLESQYAALEPLQPDEHGVVLNLAETPDELADDAIEQLGLPTAPG